MPTRYIGVFCPRAHFTILRTYEVEHLAAPLSVGLKVDPTELQCEQCDNTFLYRQSDVAHSNWPDGRDAKYPHRDDAVALPKTGPHGLAIREGFPGPVEHADRHRYHVATYDCQCGVGYRIFVNEVHYDLGRQFQNYVKDLLEYVHKNGGPHPDVIQIPMEAEFYVSPNR